MWAQVKKFAPVTAFIGYLLVYMNKGWGKVLTDLQGITPEKLQAKWKNIVVAIVAGAVIFFIWKSKMSVEVKALILVVLYFVLGYNLGTAIDPVNGNGAGPAGYAGSMKYNRYALGGK